MHFVNKHLLEYFFWIMTTAVSGLPFDTLEHLDVNVNDSAASFKIDICCYLANNRES